MVSFTGSAGPVNGVGTIFEWSDVLVVVENNAIVQYTTQFGGISGQFPNGGAAVSIGGGFNVQLTSLTYRHFGYPVGAATLDIANGVTFRQAASGFTMTGKLTNNGSITVQANTTVTGAIENNNLMTVGTGDSNVKHMLLRPVAGAFTLSGSGDMRLRDGILAGEGGESSLTSFSNSSKITGFGQIGSDFGHATFPSNGGYLRVTNTAAGTIEANVDGKTLAVSTQLSAVNPVVNAGLLAASGGGKLVLQGSVLNQTGAGTIKAFNGSTVELNDIKLQGGTIDGQGTGVVAVMGSTTTIQGIDITATGILNTGRYLGLSGAIENRGKMVANTSDGNVNIGTNGVVLSGGGTFQMVGAYDVYSITGASGAILTNLDHTIFGIGTISGGTLAIVNSGVISARPDAYRTDINDDVLRIDQISSITNGLGGVLEASGAATLELVNTRVNNDGGTIRAVSDGAKVSLSVVEITGGTLHTQGNAVIRVDGSGVRLDDVQTTATTMLNAGRGFTLEGSFVNRGTLTAEDFGATVRIDASDVLLTGGGTVVLRDNFGDAQIVGDAPGAVLTNTNNTIRGDGFIGGGNLSLANAGFIFADPDAREDGVGNLSIQSLASFTNSGTIGARGGARLHLNNPGDGKIANVGGTISSDGAGSIVNLNNAVIAGGTLVGTNGGKFGNEGGTWDGTTSKVTATNVNIDAAGTLRIKGTIEHSGAMHFGDTRILYIDGNTTLSGGGTFFTHAGFNDDAAVRASAEGFTLNNVNNTFAGRGDFGAGGRFSWTGLGFTFINGANGTVTANEAGATLNIVTGNTITNNGRLVADKGTLNVFDNLKGSGRIEITNGGTAIVDQGTDQRVVFVGASADTLSLSRRESAAGSFGFTIADMGVGDRIKLDVGATAGNEASFAFDHVSGFSILRSAAFTDGTTPYAITLIGNYSEGQFRFIGGADNALGLVRMLSRDGGTGNDAMTAAAGGERLIGFEGDDVLTSGFGNDVLDGSLGNDTADFIKATAGVSVDLSKTTDQNVGGGLGIDRLYSIENLRGSTFGDVLVGSNGNNSLFGRAGADTLVGGLGNDTLDGGANPEGSSGQGDVMLGGDGNDIYYVNSGLDLVDEGSYFPSFGFGGTDTIISTTDFYWDIASVGETVQVAESVVDPGNDDGVTIVGGVFNNTLIGHSKTDVLFGRGGSDIYRAGDGIDFMSLSTLGVTDVGAYVANGANTVIVDKRTTGVNSYDIVFEFESGKDKLNVSDYGFASKAAAFATGVNDGAGNSYFVLGDGFDYLYMVGLTLSELSANDFIV